MRFAPVVRAFASAVSRTSGIGAIAEFTVCGRSAASWRIVPSDRKPESLLRIGRPTAARAFTTWYVLSGQSAIRPCEVAAGVSVSTTGLSHVALGMLLLNQDAW